MSKWVVENASGFNDERTFYDLYTIEWKRR